MKHRVVQFTDKFELRRAPVVEGRLFTDSNDIGTASVKSEDENPPEIAESTRRYPSRKTSHPPCLEYYVTNNESEDFVIMSIFAMF